MKKPQQRPNAKVRFVTSGASLEASKKLSSKEFSKAVEKDQKMVSAHKIKKK